MSAIGLTQEESYRIEKLINPVSVELPLMLLAFRISIQSATYQ
jgi:hypothetical protein